MSKRKYICSDCKNDFMVNSMPKCCPYCGGINIGTNKKKSEIHAAEIITQMRELRTAVETAWQTYTIEYVRFEALRQKAVTYARRGIISENDIPTIRKTKLADELRTYRGGTKHPVPNPNPNYKPPLGRDKTLQDIVAGNGLQDIDTRERFDDNNLPVGLRLDKRS